MKPGYRQVEQMAPGLCSCLLSATPLKLAAKDCNAGTPWMATGSPAPTHVRFANAMPFTGDGRVRPLSTD